AVECINYNEDENRMVETCNENPQCTVKEIDISENFKFDVCTPQYPKGFDSREGQVDNEILCSLASQTCVVTYQKNFLGKWKCIDNCGCEKKEFGEKMNDLCISLGDCGSYVNYIGKGTDNIQLTNSPNIPWTTYTNFANPVEGQYAELSEGIYPSAFNGIDDIIGQDFPETLDVSTLTTVASGAGGTDLVLTVTGVSITEAGVRNGADSEIIVADADTAVTNQYFETTKKWLGQTTYTLTGSSGTFDFNYGYAAYEDFGNRAFTVTDFEATGEMRANETGLNIELLHHEATAFVYSAAAFVPNQTALVSLATDYSTDNDVASGIGFAYKRRGFDTMVDGADSEGLIIRITTVTNNSINDASAHIGVTLN
ncbi:hypothetical protein LCGC14_2799630, partial [marine sediment metagenome]